MSSLIGDFIASGIHIPSSIFSSDWDVQASVQDIAKLESDKSIFDKKKSITIGSLTDALLGAISSIFQQKGVIYKKIASFDSFISFNGVRESQIVQNAIEQGSFRSINKKDKPNTCVVELATGGSQATIESCLDRLKKVEGSLILCRVKTPFGVMDNMNLIKLEYSYTVDNGAHLLIAKMTFQEVREGFARKSFTARNLLSPADSNTQNGGNKALLGG